MPEIQRPTRAERREGQRERRRQSQDRHRIIGVADGTASSGGVRRTAGTGEARRNPRRLRSSSSRPSSIPNRASERAPYRRWFPALFSNPWTCLCGFVICVALLLGLGIVMVFSSSEVDLISQGKSPFKTGLTQIILAFFGLLLGATVNFIPIRWYKRFSWVVLLGCLVLQVLTVTAFGRSVGGNAGWVYIGGFSFQPAEFLKLALCVWMPAAIISSQQQGAGAIKAYIGPGLLFALSIAFVMLGKDMGTALIVGMVGVVALVAGGISLKFFLSCAAPVGIFAVLYSLLGSSNRMGRVKALVSGCRSSAQASTVCYQSNHGRFAISSGGLFGVGLGKSREKWNYLPEAHNDFIFAIISEELGFIGAITVILLFVLLAAFLIGLAHTMVELPYERLVIVCVAAWISLQAFMNIMVVVGLLPVIGVPLPFISAGGSSMISCLMAVGVAVRMARQQPEIALRFSGRARPKREEGNGHRKQTGKGTVGVLTRLSPRLRAT